jgi:hypothetical protein
VAEGVAATPIGAALGDTEAGADVVADTAVAVTVVAVHTVEVVAVAVAEDVDADEALVGMNPSATGTIHQRSLKRLALKLALKCTNSGSNVTHDEMSLPQTLIRLPLSLHSHLLSAKHRNAASQQSPS